MLTSQPCAAPETWFSGYPLYEIYPRAFSPEGSFQAITTRLEALKSVGVENLWLMPIHPIGELGRKGSLGCPYSVRDYFSVNPELGTPADFAALVQQAHRLGMRVIIDVVANHCANDHALMANHPAWFYRDSTGAFSREVADWSDVTDWDFDNSGTRAYLDSALIYWVKEFDVDGYRCDVAGMIPDDFWQGIIPRLRALKPDLFMLAEWETPQMHRNGFDATYDWTLYHRMVAHRQGKISLDSLWQALVWREQSYPPEALPLRFIENHDQERAAAVFGKESYRPYAALIFTLPGIPLLYNGQEVGAAQRPSLFEKEPIDWAQSDAGVEQFYRELLRLRQSSPALRWGKLERIPVKPAASVLAFKRIFQDQSTLVLINFSVQPVQAKVDGKQEKVELEGWGYKIITE